MPKIKTHKGAKSRFHITGSGKIMRTKGGKSHLRRRKSKRAKRLFDDTIPLSPSDKVRIRRLLPYG
ncbi:50S ribosomal protein L35 [Dehalococcoidales bacterium]|nr:50S ribosomal protein L35 [Dehalococcoidales bacterium]MCL0053073.1 50S ribosomal protein L35 [Dehalococcoidales bacterium]MCL0094503.1 50S ribosomal protein L35 [Dehalococcoidales bacterium]